MTKTLTPIILAGGTGKRLWPLSTDENPKQFLTIFKDLSLFDLTLNRISNKLFTKPIIVTQEKYLSQIQESLKKSLIKPSLIVLEPEGKNTLGAVTSAIKLALKINQKKKFNFIVMPSDHFVSNQCQFISAIKNSLLGLNDRALFLFGIEAKKFSSEFGYIQLKSQDSLEVKTFIEKPSSSKIKYDLNGKNYFCNSGIFVFEGNWYVDQLNKIEKRFLDNISLAIDQGTRRKNLFYISKMVDNADFF